MASGTKHTATLPDGTIAKRHSLNRVYSHCVAWRRDGQAALDHAKRSFISDNHRSNFAYYMELIDGTSPHLFSNKPVFWRTEEEGKIADEVAIQRAIEALGGATTAQEYFSIQKAAFIADVEGAIARGVYEKWIVEGWASRRDLAENVAAKCRSYNFARDVTIIEAVRG
jgi:hypothetical protein